MVHKALCLKSTSFLLGKFTGFFFFLQNKAMKRHPMTLFLCLPLTALTETAGRPKADSGANKKGGREGC